MIQSAADIFNKHASDYQSKFMDVSLYADTLDLFCEQLPPGAKVLELACGPGNITRYLLDKRPGLCILATDIAPNMLELAKANNPEASFQWLDCKDMSGIKDTYDAVMCGFCLPYLSGPESRKLINELGNRIKPGGTLYLSCMEENKHHQSGIKTNSHGDHIYVYYHTADKLLESLSSNHFQLVELSRKQIAASDGSSTTELMLIASKTGITFE